MIIRKVRLHPFAGLSDKELSFEPGLNVLFGRNDVGKTTIFRAIENALFTPVDLKMNKGLDKEFVAAFIPISGDHAAVMLEIEKDGRKFILEKKWGEAKLCQMSGSDGLRLGGSKAVTENLEKLFPTSVGTFRSILFIPQGSLIHTISELSRNNAALHSLGDILRMALNEAGGVSVDKLKAALQEKYEETFLNWDATTNMPRGGRGIGNPWNHTGMILKAYYQKEMLKQQFRETEKLEQAFGEKSNLLADIQKRHGELEKFLADNRAIIEADSAREALRLKAERAAELAKHIQNALMNWQKAEVYLSEAEPLLVSQQQKVEALGLEMSKAREAGLRQTIITRFAQIQAKKKELDAVTRALSQLRQPKPEELRELRRTQGEIETARASLSGGKLKVVLQPKAKIGIGIRPDLEPERKEVLTPGVPLEITAGGCIQLGTEVFDLTVTSGGGNFDTLAKRLAVSQQRADELLKSMGVKSLEEAQHQAEEYNRVLQTEREQRAALNSLLSGETFERWEEKASSAQSGPPLREPALVAKEYNEAIAAKSRMEEKCAVCRDKIAEYRRVYAVDTAEQLMQLLINKSTEKKEAEAELAKLPALPADVGNPEAYRLKFKQTQAELPGLTKQILQLSGEVHELQARLPECSAQDYERQYREAEQVFERACRVGRSITKVMNTVSRLESASGDIYQELNREFSGRMQKLCNHKYSVGRTSGALPASFIRKDSVDVPYDLLSTGTKDAVALSLRLSMAKYFLGSAAGVILMDDPMVSMDEERQKIAAEVLSEFSQKTQVIVFTCHRSHADLFGGNRIEF